MLTMPKVANEIMTMGSLFVSILHEKSKNSSTSKYCPNHQNGVTSFYPKMVISVKRKCVE